MDSISKIFRTDVTLPFDGKRLSLTREPIITSIDTTNFHAISGPRINNFLISAPQMTRQEIVHAQIILPSAMRMFSSRCLAHAASHNLPLSDRYVYLTCDNKPVPPHQTQREVGWHIDGMQGPEVKVLKPGCYQYVWWSAMAPEFTVQLFHFDTRSRKTLNWFEEMSKQVDNTQNIKLNIATGKVVLMNTYNVHRVTPNETDETRERLFLRLYISHQEITSVTATPNPNVDYQKLNFLLHSTSGKFAPAVTG